MTTDPPTHTSLAAALSALQGETQPVTKTNRADAGRYGYAYADLADIMRAVGPTLGRHGLAWTCLTSHGESGWVITGRLMHGPSGEVLEASLPINVAQQPQQLGSALTYARRYLLTSVLGLATDEDDDGAAAQAPQRPQQRPAEPARELSDEDAAPLLDHVENAMSDLPPAERGEPLRAAWKIAQQRGVLDHMIAPRESWGMAPGPMSVGALITAATTHQLPTTEDPS